MMAKSSIDIDEVCQVCGSKRDDHGDRQHKFSRDGQLIALDRPPAPRKQPPQTREEAAAHHANGEGLGVNFAVLVEVLAEKGILDVKDVIRILLGKG